MTDRFADTQPLGSVVGSANSGTTIGPATVLPPLWMCPAIAVPTFFSVMLKQTRRLRPLSVMRAEPLPFPAWGTSALPLRCAVSVVAAPATSAVPRVSVALASAATAIDLRVPAMRLSRLVVGTPPRPTQSAPPGFDRPGPIARTPDRCAPPCLPPLPRGRRLRRRAEAGRDRTVSDRPLC